MKKTLALTFVAVLVLLATSGSAIRAQPSKTISCVMDIQVVCVYDANGIPTDCWWEGPVTGCVLSGTVFFRGGAQANYGVGSVEHFFEAFEFRTDDGSYIKGEDTGLWNFSTFKFRANGWVTEASPRWAYLVGAKFHEMGTTSDPNGWPVTGLGTTMTLH